MATRPSKASRSHRLYSPPDRPPSFVSIRPPNVISSSRSAFLRFFRIREAHLTSRDGFTCRQCSIPSSKRPRQDVTLALAECAIAPIETPAPTTTSRRCGFLMSCRRSWGRSSSIVGGAFLLGEHHVRLDCMCPARLLLAMASRAESRKKRSAITLRPHGPPRRQHGSTGPARRCSSPN